jgi:uncharacterized protein with HEPN domain
MSSEPPPGGRSPTTRRALETAVRVAKRAIARIQHDTLESYLSNEERQEAIERLLLRFGEALKAVPPELLKRIDPNVEWDKPIRFRDLAAHWYEDGLDHQLIWNVLRYDLPPLTSVLESYLDSDSATDDEGT